MKKLKCALSAAILLFSLSACGASQAAPSSVVTEFTEATESTQPQTIETLVVKGPIDEAQSKRLQAYEQVLKTLLQEHQLPGGEVIWEDSSFGAMEKNTFAIADVDGDQEEELVINFTTAPMAGMLCQVYGYDAELDTLELELSVFPSVEFFTGGLVKASWSHNQGLAGERMWPYDLLGYNPASHRYEPIASVDAWDKFMAETNYDGDKYPADVDAEKAGFVYLVTENDTTRPLSRTEYEEEWYPQLFGSAEAISLTERKLTDENITAACTTE